MYYYIFTQTDSQHDIIC